MKKGAGCKPGPVGRLAAPGGHLSWTHVAMRLERPTQPSNGADHALGSIWPFSRRGLPCEACHQAPGALLPHLFTLAPRVSGVGGVFSVALSLGLPPVGVTHRRVLWSPDFPPSAECGERPPACPKQQYTGNAPEIRG